MDRRTLIIGAAVLLLGGGGLVLMRRDRSDPEAEIRAMLERGSAAVEQQDLSSLMDLLSERFTSTGLDRREVQRTLFVVLRQSAWRKVFLVNVAITLDGPQKASARFGAILTSGEAVKSLSDVMPDRSSAYRFELALEKEGRHWKVLHADYQRAGLDVLLK